MTVPPPKDPPPQAAPPPKEPGKPKPDPFLDLVARVPPQVSALIDAEVRMASAEVRSNFIRFALALGLIVAGGIILGIAGISLLGALIASLAPFVGPVWSAILTAVTALVAGAGLVVFGVLRMWRQPLAPRQSLANVKGNFESLKRKNDGTSQE